MNVLVQTIQKKRVLEDLGKWAWLLIWAVNIVIILSLFVDYGNYFVDLIWWLSN